MNLFLVLLIKDISIWLNLILMSAMMNDDGLIDKAYDALMPVKRDPPKERTMPTKKTKGFKPGGALYMTPLEKLSMVAIGGALALVAIGMALASAQLLGAL